MNSLYSYINNKTISILTLVAIITLVGTVIYTTIQNQKNQYGDGVTIQNIKKFTKQQPSDKKTLDFIEHALFNTVKKNVPASDITASSIQDAAIRDGSFSYDYKKEHTLHTVTFIVDIPSLRQSYNVSYQWVDDKRHESARAEYGTIVSCIRDDAKKIYKEFQCVDMFTAPKAADPIIQYLPHTTTNVTVTYNLVRKSLEATIKLSAADERTGANAAIEQYKKEIRDWIASKNLNPDKYANTYYTVIHASLY